MIKEVEELETNPECRVLPAADLRVLHDCEIGVEIAGPTKPVPSLREGNRRTAAGTRRSRQVSAIKSSYATLLHEARGGVG